MGWNDEEVQNTKKGMNASTKVLLGIIACIIFIIILLIVILMNNKSTSFKIYVDGGVSSKASQETLINIIDGVKYVNIEEFAGLVGYDYHKGEYKSSIIETDKCYVEGEIETASFYLNDNTIYKLPVKEREKQYQEFVVEDAIRSVNNKMYASYEAVSKAFNVVINETSNSIQIYTLEYLVKLYNANVKKWGYADISEQGFENHKAILYGCLIVKKQDGLFKIIDLSNTKEIVLDRYTTITFSENTQEFFVTDNYGKMGIVNLDGTSKIEPNYDKISTFDKEADLYLVEQSKKYGIVKSGNITVIFPEYDSIGLSSNPRNTSKNKNLILDTLIPVCKDKKWGAFNKQGNLVLNIEYDAFGFDLTSIEIDGIKESVEPILAIERANGVVVKKGDKYGLFSMSGQELVPIAVDAIYAIPDVTDVDSKYFMLYYEDELNVIERLIIAGLIKDTSNEETNEPTDNNTQNNIENEINNSYSNIVED